MYDPKTARFLQEDTYRGDPNDPLSLNLYTYCNNEPIMYLDPTGHAPWNQYEVSVKEIKQAKQIQKQVQQRKSTETIKKISTQLPAAARTAEKEKVAPTYEELGQAQTIKEQVNENLAKKETNTVAVKSNKNVVSSFIDGAKGKVVDTKVQLVKQFANNPIGTYVQAVIDNANPLKQNAFVKLYDIGSEAYNGLIKGNANQKAEYLGGVAGHTAESVLFSGAIRLPAKVKAPTIQSGTGLLKNFLVEEHGSIGLPGSVGGASKGGINQPRFPSDPNKMFPENYPGMTKKVQPDGKIIYEVEAGGKNYKVEYHPNHGGEDHFDGNHYHVKKQSDFPPPGKTKPIDFRIPNLDPNTPAIPGGGTFAPGDLLPTLNKK
ncbi:MAG: hypothetical protein N3B21_02985 [Clostridia bacterium]|nr:hypothetical protein [Clostridia bacterium]